MLVTRMMYGPTEIGKPPPASLSVETLINIMDPHCVNMLQGRSLMSTSMDSNHPHYAFVRPTDPQDWRGRDWEEEAIERVATPPPPHDTNSYPLTAKRWLEHWHDCFSPTIIIRYCHGTAPIS